MNLNLQDITIVYPPVIDYKFLYQRPQQLMKALAQCGVNTVFVNPGHMFPQKDPVYIPFPELPNFKVVRHDEFVKNTKQYINGFKILWISYGGSLDFYQLTKPDFVVYDSIDNAADEFAHWKQYIPRLEKIADIIFASADIMYEDHLSRFTHTYLLPNATDYEHFAVARDRIGERPSEFPTSGTIVGYYGAMATWLDVDIVKRIADYYNVVMIGATPSYNQSVVHDRVTILPLKQYEELPRYLSWFDATTIPFKLTEMMRGTNPVKAFEYLSAGKPTLVTDMHEMRKFKDNVYIVDRNNVVETIGLALRENNNLLIKKRQEFARQNSWLSRSRYALTKIQDVLESR